MAVGSTWCSLQERRWSTVRHHATPQMGQAEVLFVRAKLSTQPQWLSTAANVVTCIFPLFNFLFFRWLWWCRHHHRLSTIFHMQASALLFIFKKVSICALHALAQQFRAIVKVVAAAWARTAFSGLVLQRQEEIFLAKWLMMITLLNFLSDASSFH